MALSAAQVQEFDEQGVIIVKGVFTDDDLQPVRDEIAAWVDDRARELHAQGELEDLYEAEPFETRYGLLFKQNQDIGKGLDIMFYRGPAMFQFLHNKNLLDTVESLVGSEITCNPIQHLRAKPPAEYEGNFGAGFHNVPWHQDAGVMMAEAENSNILTCWLPLGDATVDMGCMKALPGVIKTGYLEHVKEGGTTVNPNLMPDTEPVNLECYKGDLVLMSRFTPHHSTPNLSDKCRWSLDLRYQTTGHHTGRTAHPEFVVRSPSNPASVMDDYDQWCHLWIDAFENPRGFAGHRSV
ncbi:MAG: phytanoyl-CoA dioxygenase family protein [Chloroflexota bacterium]